MEPPAAIMRQYGEQFRRAPRAKGVGHFGVSDDDITRNGQGVVGATECGCNCRRTAALGYKAGKRFRWIIAACKPALDLFHHVTATWASLGNSAATGTEEQAAERLRVPITI